MKIFGILLLLVLPIAGFSQTDDKEGKTLNVVPMENNPADENNIYNTAGIDVVPQFPGGLQEFYNYVGNTYRRPADDKLHGKIFVTFVVEKDGSLGDIKVLRDIGHGTGKEAIRVLKNCPKWIPGEQNGKKVRVLYSVPIQL
jgi:periplasmic protein TonB